MDAELQFILDSLSQTISRPAAIDDPRFNVLAYSAHQSGDLDSVRSAAILTLRSPPDAQEWLRSQRVLKATAPVRLDANAEVGMDARLCIPLRAKPDGVLLGFLWFTEAAGERLSDAEVAIAVEAGDAAAAVLYRHQFRTHTTRAREAELMNLLLGGDRAARETAARSLSDEGLLRESGGVGIIVARLEQPGREGGAEGEVGIEQALDRFRRSLAPRKCLTLFRGDHSVALLAADEPRVQALGLPGVCARLLAGLQGTAPEGDGSVWVAGCAMGPGSTVEAHVGYRRALDAALVAQRIAGMGPVVDWSALGAYRYVAELARSSSLALPEAVDRLLDLPSEGGLVETLECYLDTAGDVKASAAALSLHRASLYYRLEKIEAVTGLDLKSGDDRLELQLGLKLARLAGRIPVRAGADTSD
jgi:hypothetical protein